MSAEVRETERLFCVALLTRLRPPDVAPILTHYLNARLAADPKANPETTVPVLLIRVGQLERELELLLNQRDRARRIEKKSPHCMQDNPTSQCDGPGRCSCTCGLCC